MILGSGGVYGQMKGPQRAPSQLGRGGPEKPGLLLQDISPGPSVHMGVLLKTQVRHLGAGWPLCLWEHYCRLPTHLGCLYLGLAT